MISREFNINLDIIRINKYIKTIQVYQNDVYQCIFNIKVFRDTKELNLANKDAIIHILTSNQDLLRYENYVVENNILKVRMADIDEVGAHTLHIMLVNENQKHTLPLIKFEVMK